MRNFLVIMLIFILTSCGDTPPSVDRGTLMWETYGDLYDELEFYVHENDYKMLEKLGNEIRTKGLRFQSGMPALWVFYSGIKQTHNVIQNTYEFIEKWRNASPETNMPYIVYAIALCDRAGDIRGTATIDKISDAIYAEFKAKLKESWDMILIAEDKGPVDAELLNVKMELMFLLHGDKESAYKIMDQCFKVDPTYYPAYLTMMHFLQGKWYGSDKEMMEFVDNYSSKARSIEGDGVYARLAYGRVRYSNNLFKEGFSWKRAKKGFHHLFKRYGKNEHLLYRYGYLAMLVSDHKALAEVIDEVGIEWNKLKQNYFKKKSWYEWHANKAKKYL